MERILWIEAMRGFAALWVVAHHTSASFKGVFGFTGEIPTVFLNGYLGVDFFFVLSGFIIYMSSEKLEQSGRGIKEYATLRALRIYIPYLPIGLAIYILYTLFPSFSQGTRSSLSLLTSATLLPTNSPPALSVAWTLVHELIFYVIFSLFFLSKRLLIVFLSIWSIAMAYVWQAEIALPRTILYFLSPLNFCFLIGAATYHASKYGIDKNLARAALLVGLSLLIWQSIFMNPNRVWVALGFALLVMTATSKNWLNHPPNQIFLLLGAASYSIYLIHNPALAFLMRASKMAGVGSGTAAIASASIALAMGIGYHMIYERTVLKKIRSFLNKVEISKKPTAAF